MASEFKVKCITCGELVQLRSDNSCTRCGTRNDSKKADTQPKLFFKTSALDDHRPMPKPVIVKRQPADEVVDLQLSDLVSSAKECIFCDLNRKLHMKECAMCGKLLTSKSAV